MKDVDQKYKNYISDFTGVFYPRIMEASRIKTKIPRKLNEESAQYFFVLASFFEDDLAIQLDIKEIHKILKYTMDSFVKFKGKDCVKAISRSFEYFNIIKKKWMKG
jgi:rRNA processing protein Krr1/Pno1